ncbi:hypothetical protein acdb102_22410 [Acidothermaceae bacterium B102]|nr:hypothetical protein acdb102_22410 [Acidothermaceae bacterium B102]
MTAPPPPPPGEPATGSTTPPTTGRPARHRLHQRPARNRTILIRLDDAEYAKVVDGAHRAGLTPAGFAATAAVRTAQGVDLAADITWREALHELIQARTQIRRYAVNVNQIAAALNAGVGAPPWTQHAILTTTAAVHRLDTAAAALMRRRT